MFSLGLVVNHSVFVCAISRSRSMVFTKMFGDICICKAIDFDSFPALKVHIYIFFLDYVRVRVAVWTKTNPTHSVAEIAGARLLVYNSLIVNLNAPINFPFVTHIVLCLEVASHGGNLTRRFTKLIPLHYRNLYVCACERASRLSTRRVWICDALSNVYIQVLCYSLHLFSVFFDAAAAAVAVVLSLLLPSPPPPPPLQSSSFRVHFTSVSLSFTRCTQLFVCVVRNIHA